MTTLTTPQLNVTKITRRLAEYVTSLAFSDLPETTVEKAKQAVLDHLGNAIRAATEGGSSVVVRKVVDRLGAPGKATAVGIGPHYQPHYAALLNATFGHTLDFDDTHERSSLHPGVTTIPAALAVAEETRAPGERAIAAIVAGYDVTVRISEAADAASQYDRGFHPTATCGTFGATAAAANVAGAGADVLENAFGLNGSQAAGSLQFLENGAWNKRLHCGFTAHNAIIALRLAQAGAVGAQDALEGRSGFFRGYSDDADPEQAVRTLGEQFAIDETGFKPYPSCRYSHAAIDLLREIVEQEKIVPDTITAVRIGLPRKGIDLIGIPEAQKRTPLSVVDGQFSMHFLAAVALLHGRMTWDDYALLGDGDVKKMMQRIEVGIDPEIESRFPTMAARVEVIAGDRTIRRVNWTPKGEPSNPMDWEELEAKFSSLAQPLYTGDRCTRIIEMVRSLELLDDVGELTTLLGPSK